MIVRSKAPLRIGLAGGGSDVSPYSDIYGGIILNATINLYAYCTIEETDDGLVTIESYDTECFERYPLSRYLEIDGKASLLKGSYNRVMQDYNIPLRACKITTYNDAPAGSGLGSSSTMVVAILKAFVEWHSLPLGDYEIARLAYEIERKDLNLSGGKQDQYAATFGGFNYMQFLQDDKVIVNPLRIRQRYQDELAHNLLLYYTETSHVSAEIIQGQIDNVKAKNNKSIEAMHQLKEQAVWMKESLLKGDIDAIGEILQFGWEHKKKTASGITNPLLDEIYKTAVEAGATGGKVSGAGGGGFMFFYCPGTSRYAVEKALCEKFSGQVKRYEFTQEGLKTWTL